MGIIERVVVAALLAAFVALAPVQAQETLRPTHVGADNAHVCLNQKERRALVENGTVMRLDAALHVVRSNLPGTLVRARLCRRPEGFAYVLTVLAHDGKVIRVVVDAVKGTLVGER
jgi:uncharacterized membrane protein YkoI